jgi:S-methylmethionine-dependent homocysteine/selenocysteine methylase
MSGDLIVLDGGLGGELIRRGWPSGGLWSAKALVEQPEIIRNVHDDYINAGARVIITNTYSTIPSYLDKSGMGDSYLELTEKAGRIARAAADESEFEVKVAASIPPLSESYRPDLVPEAEVALPIYGAMADRLAPFTDVYLCETMSSIQESKNAVTAIRSVNQTIPIWVAWTLNDEPGAGLRSGESISEAVAALSEDGIEAFLFNCTDPRAISHGIKELSTVTDKAYGAYPNKFYVPDGWTLDNEIATEPRELTPEDFRSFADRWRQDGASIIGGCCGLGPEYIAALAS